jgi:beta-glucosidase
VLTGLLRQELGFSGLVVTDALVMEAISGHYGTGEAAVLAVEAGADLVLMPADACLAIEALVAAVEQGRLSEEQLEASAERRRAALAQVRDSGTEDAPPTTAIEALLAPIEPDQALARELVSATLIRRDPQPRLTGGHGVNLLRLDDALAAPFLPARSPALQLPAANGLRSVVFDGRSPSPWSGEPEAPLALERLGEGPVLLQLFVRGNPFRGSAAGREPWAAAVQQLQAAGRLAGLVVYGSPYLWEQLEPLLEPCIPAVYSPGQMPLAQQQALAALGLGHTDGAGGFTD